MKENTMQKLCFITEWKACLISGVMKTKCFSVLAVNLGQMEQPVLKNCNHIA